MTTQETVFNAICITRNDQVVRIAAHVRWVLTRILNGAKLGRCYGHRIEGSLNDAVNAGLIEWVDAADKYALTGLGQATILTK